ncbi:hypothetical protein [Mucilaginibacter frigoritolerans]|nr:hypothetical protein [Mucilaginibacter frigoritolerans]
MRKLLTNGYTSRPGAVLRTLSPKVTFMFFNGITALSGSEVCCG